MGMKLVTIYENNTALPTHQAIIQLFRASTGEPLAMLDGRLITEMRTAAATAIAARLFTAHKPHTLAILGSGVQARAHLRALRHVRDIREVRVWSRTPAHAEAFAYEMGAAPLPLEHAIRGADIVIGVANVTEPLILGKYLAPDAFVAAIAAVGAGKRELDDEAMQATIVVESREAALRESGDIIDTGTPIYAELGEILAGKFPPHPPPAESSTKAWVSPPKTSPPHASSTKPQWLETQQISRGSSPDPLFSLSKSSAAESPAESPPSPAANSSSSRHRSSTTAPPPPR